MAHWARDCGLVAMVVATCLLTVACRPEPSDSIQEVASGFGALSQVAGYDLLNVPAQVTPGTMASVEFVAPADHSLYDWIGMYPVGGAASTAWENWVRVPAGATGIVSMAVRVGARGPHEFRYFLGKSYNLAATSPTFSVTGSAGTYALSGVPATATPGSSVSARFSAPAAHSSQDWVGLYAVGAKASQYKSAAPVAAGASGTVTLGVPLAATGPHQLRYFAAASYDQVAVSSTFQVIGTPGAYALSQVPTSATPGSGVTVNFTAPATHSELDWIGLFAVGADVMAYKSWWRAPAGASGSVQLSVPLSASGQHEFRYYVGGTTELATTSASFPVAGSAGTYALSTSPESIAPGTDVTVSFDVPASHGTLDWIGLYTVGAANEAAEGEVRIPAGATGAVSLWLPISASGPHEVRYFVGDTYELATTSTAFDIAGGLGSYAFTNAPANARNGQALEVAFAAPANHSSKDWIGLFRVGATATTYVDWETVPAGAVGTVGLNVPAGTTGTHELRYYVGASDVVAVSSPVQLATATAAVAKQTYEIQEPIAVTWVGAMSASDSIAIAVAGSSDSASVTSVSTEGQWSGSFGFSGLAPGSYQARFYDASMRLLAASQDFTVWPAVTVSSDRQQYFQDLHGIYISWADHSGVSRQLSIVAVTDPNSEVGYGSTDGATNGTSEFWGFSPGRYLVRLLDGTGQVLATSSTFIVWPAPTTSTSKSDYIHGESVAVAWTSSPTLNLRFVVAPSGSDGSVINASANSFGAASGSFIVNNLPAGGYDIRLFDDAGLLVNNIGYFNVATNAGSPTVSEVAQGEPVSVVWSNSFDTGGRIVIATVGSAETASVAAIDVPASSYGTHVFEGFPVGDYEVRFFDGNSTWISTSATFSVYAHLSASKSSMAPRDFIVATWRECPPDPQNWIAIAPEGSSDTTVTVRVLAGSANGAHAFGPLSPGTYRARYFASGGYTKLFESDAVTVSSSVPVSLAQADLGSYHSCGVTPEHGVRCWGFNGNGQLGDGTNTDSDTAVQVSGITNAVAASAGGYHTCVLLSDGKVRCWGYDGLDQLGDERWSDSSIPVEVPGISNAVAVSTGEHHSCAVLNDGKVRCWGYNFYGQLGAGSMSDSSPPVEVAGISNVVAVSAGGYHTCAVLNGGTIRCWGANWYGQLGDGGMVDASTPVEVAGISDAVAVSAGGIHTCVGLSDGKVRCWGYGGNGQLGDGSGSDASTPVEVTAISDAVAVSAGSYHTCAALSDGTGYCWGYNAYGQLGIGTISDPGTPTPVQVTGLAGINSLGSGGYHSCAMQSDSTLRCWGANGNGQLGDGTCRSSSELDGFATTRSLSGGGSHTCASSLDGTIHCWGANGNGQLGNGASTIATAPVVVSGISTAIDVSVGESHSCSVLTDGHVRCWGANWANQLGDGTGNDSATPVEVADVTTAVAVSTSHFHNCALLNDSKVRCWGNNDGGQLGDGLETALSNAVAVSTGVYHSCAALDDGTVSCWGANGNGQLGDGTASDSATPVEVDGIANAVAVNLGGYHSCAVLNDGTVWCWGANWNGQLGDGTTVDRNVPVEVSGITNAVAVSAGDSHSCARLADGRVKCWGYNGYGQLGDGTATDRLLPIEIGGIANAQAVAAGYYHTCVLHSGGKLRCWGNNGEGELGDGRHPYSLVPLAVMQ